MLDDGTMSGAGHIYTATRAGAVPHSDSNPRHLVLDINSLMTLAVIGAVAIGDYAEGPKPYRDSDPNPSRARVMQWGLWL